jgi:hypothetical protein
MTPTAANGSGKPSAAAAKALPAEYANSVRQSLISKAKKEVFEGIVPQQARHVPTLEQAWLRYRSDWLEATGKSRLYQDTRCYIKHIEPLELKHRPLNRITVEDVARAVALC